MTFIMAYRLSFVLRSMCVLLLAMPVSALTRFNIWSGEHLDDLILNTDGSGTTDKHALLVIYDSSCTEEITKLGIGFSWLPPTRTLAYIMHDYTTSQEHTWLKDNGDDLRLRFKVTRCPEVLFIPRGSTKSDRATKWQWSLDHSSPSVPFLTWLWSQLKVKVTVKNSRDAVVKVRVDPLGGVRPDPVSYPEFTMIPDETKAISLYESSLVKIYIADITDQAETFLGAWEINGPTVIDLVDSIKEDQVKDLVLLDIQHRFGRGEDMAKEWLKTNSERYLLNLKQPLFVHKLTDHGYHMRQIPKKWYNLLRNFYNTHKSEAVVENWPVVDSITNYDEVPTDIVPLSDMVKSTVADAIKGGVEEWCQCKLEMTGMDGVRVYRNGSIVRHHVEHLETHVISAILQIDQQVRSPWVLEVIDNYGDRHHLSLSPGEMLMYESAKLILGHLQPLDGELYANIYFHYRPQSGWEDYERQSGLLRHGDRRESLVELDSPLTKQNAHKRKLFRAISTVKDEL